MFCLHSVLLRDFIGRAFLWGRAIVPARAHTRPRESGHAIYRARKFEFGGESRVTILTRSELRYHVTKPSFI